MDEGERRREENGDFLEILQKMFNANPGRSTIKMTDRCSQCGRKVVLSITRTSGGFGLKGGVLLKHNSVSYFLKCSDCLKS